MKSIPAETHRIWDAAQAISTSSDPREAMNHLAGQQSVEVTGRIRAQRTHHAVMVATGLAAMFLMPFMLSSAWTDSGFPAPHVFILVGVSILTGGLMFVGSFAKFVNHARALHKLAN